MIKEFVIKNPQVGAAVITAMCGIIGIIINIVINILFRYLDYKNKNRIEHIKIMEDFYLPLLHYISPFVDSLNKLNQKYTYINEIFLPNFSAEYALAKQQLTNNTTEIHTFLQNNKYRNIDDYNLYILQRNFIEIINFIKKHIDNVLIDNSKLTISDIKKNINLLEDKIEKHIVKIYSPNFISFLYHWYFLRKIKIFIRRKKNG